MPSWAGVHPTRGSLYLLHHSVGWSWIPPMTCLPARIIFPWRGAGTSAMSHRCGALSWVVAVIGCPLASKSKPFSSERLTATPFTPILDCVVAHGACRLQQPVRFALEQIAANGLDLPGVAQMHVAGFPSH